MTQPFGSIARVPRRIRDAVPRLRARLAHARLPVIALTLILLTGIAAAPALAKDEAGPLHRDTAPSLKTKLTLGWYGYDGAGPGRDINLRVQQGDTHAWIGRYGDDGAFGAQWRAGLDTGIDIGDTGIQWQPSVQVATGGLVGGSLTLQGGQPWWWMAGWGRTNGRPYVNLNYDPNDAITLGGGWREADGGRQVGVWVVADDRFGTGQRDWHLAGHMPTPWGVRIGADLLHKTGTGDLGPVRGTGLTLTVDGRHAFVRIARDPKMNFSAHDATRVAVGLRF